MMRIFNRKSRMQRLLKTVSDSLDLPVADKKFSLPDLVSSSRVKARLPHQDTAVKASVIGVAVAGLTAASAGISSLRRTGGARGDS